MHDGGPPAGDAFLALFVPLIMASPAYRNGGALFITWDEDDYGTPQQPIGMMVLSPFARGGGYQNSIYYTHSSTLRTFQNIFGLRPYLADAANATDLSDLFTINALPPEVAPVFPNGPFTFTLGGLTSNVPVYVQATTNLAGNHWVTIGTNPPATNQVTFTDPKAASFQSRFYRLSPTP